MIIHMRTKKLKQVRHISVLTYVSTRRFHQNRFNPDIGAFLLVKNNTERTLIGLGQKVCLDKPKEEGEQEVGWGPIRNECVNNGRGL